MSEDLTMIPELPQPLTALKDKFNNGAYQRGPQRYGLITGHLKSGKEYSTERSQGAIETANDINLGKGVLIITRPHEDEFHETIVKIGEKVTIGDYATIQAAALPNSSESNADLAIGNSATLEEGVEVYNRNFHPMPGDEEEKRLFTTIGGNVVVGRYSIVLLGSHVVTDIPPFSIVILDKDGETKIIGDTNGLGEKYEAIIKKLKSGKPAIKTVPIIPVGVTEYGTTFSVSGDETKILLGKCNFVPNGPLLITEGNGSISIGKGFGKTAFINRRSQLWAIDHPIVIEDGAQIAWNVLITTDFENQHGAVTIGRNSWIGSNAIVLPGVTIGESSIVAAGAIVTEDVPNHVLVAGRPAIIKRELVATSAMRGKETRFD